MSGKIQKYIKSLSFDKYQKTAENLGVNLNWRAFGGEGEMIVKPGNYKSNVVTYLHGGHLKRDNNKYNWYKGEVPRWYQENDFE